MTTAETASPAAVTAPPQGVAGAWNADVGAVVIVHPHLSPATADALRSAGFARLADTRCVEVWLRYPAE